MLQAHVSLNKALWIPGFIYEGVLIVFVTAEMSEADWLEGDKRSWLPSSV